MALENLRGLGWMDLTFGQLDGWWRFADEHYRPDHALATPDVWRRALGDAGFEGVEVLGVDDSFSFEMLDKGVIVAQGPAQVEEPPGVWVVTSGGNGAGEELAQELAARNQTVVLAGGRVPEGEESAVGGSVISKDLDPECRDAWRSLIEDLPGDVPFTGVVHLRGLAGRGPEATTEEMAEDIRQAGASALALVQGLADSDATPANGVWFITRGAQVLERERLGELSGSILWGLGKVVTLEAAHLQPRMIDLDPGLTDPMSDLVDEFLYPDHENHIAHRSGRRLAARLVRPDAVAGRLALPEEPNWVLEPDRDGVFDRPQIKLLPARSLAPREVRVAVEASGLNFWDVFRSLGFIEEGDLGRELCGYVVDTGSDVSNVSVGDHVVGLGFGAFAPRWSPTRSWWRRRPTRCPPPPLPPFPAPSCRPPSRTITRDWRQGNGS